MKSRPLALLITGKASSCVISRLRNLAEAVGPVKAPTFRQASRFTNTLRAGFPVHDCVELDSSRLILICAGRRQLEETLNELTGARLHWRRKTVIHCAPEADSEALAPLAERGARTGSMTPAGDPEDRRFYVEGEGAAVRAIRRVVEAGGGRTLEIGAGCQRLSAAASDFATWLLLPQLDAAIECLRLAGLSRGQATPIVERMVARVTRAYVKGGRRSWKWPGTELQQSAFSAHLSALREADPELAALLLESARLSLRRMGRSDAWLDKERPASRSAAAGA